MKLEYAITKPVDDYCSTVELFRGVLCSNKRIVFKDPDGENQQPVLLFDGRELKHSIESTPVREKEIMFHMIIEAGGNEEEQAKTLEQFDDVINELIRKVDYQFTINTLWNDVTTYYGKRLYPEISHVENMLRKIIYLFMLKTVGRDWLNTDAPEKFRKEIYSVMDKNKLDFKNIHEDCLVYADFITLGYFFTAPYALNSDINALFSELEQYKTVAGKKRKKALNEEALHKLAEEYKPKNNWDRYFSDKLKVDSPKKFSHDWSSLYEIRNKVAHGRPVGKADYDKAMKLVSMFSSAFKKCISVIDELVVTDEQADAVGVVAQRVIQPNSFKELTQTGIMRSTGVAQRDWIIEHKPIRGAVGTVSGMGQSSILKSKPEGYGLVSFGKPSISVSAGELPHDLLMEIMENNSEYYGIDSLRIDLDRPIEVSPVNINGLDGLRRLDHFEAPIETLKNNKKEESQKKMDTIEEKGK